jgi:putative tricarboxylic transport membrane protein
LGIFILGNMMAADVFAQASYPNKSIEYVVQAGAGGASDAFVRTIAMILQTEKIIPVSFIVMNKPGGAGAIAFGYTAQKAGNPYYLLNAAGNFIATPLEKPKVPGYKDFTTIGLLAQDQNAIAVNAESPYKSIKELVEAAKKKPKDVRWGGTSNGSQDHMTMNLTQKSAKCEFNFISFTTESETMAALLGGHIDVGGFNPKSIQGQVEANKLRILALSSEKRLPGMPNIPNMIELGYQVVTPMQRGVVAPKGIPSEARDYLIAAFKKLIQTKAWKKYAADNVFSEEGRFGDDYFKYLAAETEKLRVIMIDLGLIKS